MTLLLIIFAIATFALLAWVIMKMEQLDDYQDNLDKYSVHLDERANMLARWEDELKKIYNDTDKTSKENN
jgi:hypothetical protein